MLEGKEVKVLFVGDKPSRLNAHSNIAFVGTPSFKNLRKWVEEMQILDFIAVNSQELDVPFIVRAHVQGYLMVALGNNASKVLTIMGLDHFKLPHPSPKNRKLNDKGFIASELQKCYSYLKERK
jgi:uracil-DNA glycosylase